MIWVTQTGVTVNMRIVLVSRVPLRASLLYDVQVAAIYCESVRLITFARSLTDLHIHCVTVKKV